VSFEPSTVKIHPGVRPGRVPENKKQDRTTKKKRHNSVGLIFHICGEKPPLRLQPKFGTWVDVQDIITHAKF